MPNSTPPTACPPHAPVRPDSNNPLNEHLDLRLERRLQELLDANLIKLNFSFFSG